MTAPTTNVTTMGAEVISKGLFLTSFVSPRPNRRKYLYKVMVKSRESFPTPTYNTPSKDNKDGDE